MECYRTVNDIFEHMHCIDKYQLLLLDVTLPDVQDLKCVERYANKIVRFPLFFLTASDQEVDVIRGLDSGGDDYITKTL